jgi:hypothetical protein
VHQNLEDYPMQIKSHRSATEVAMLTIFLIVAYNQEKSKTTTRVRISQATLRVISERKRLRGSFVEEWIDELADFGWSAFRVGDHFALILTETVEGWVRIGTKRIRSTLLRISIGDDEALAEVARVVVPKAPPEEVDED